MRENAWVMAAVILVLFLLLTYPIAIMGGIP